MKREEEKELMDTVIAVVWKFIEVVEFEEGGEIVKPLSALPAPLEVVVRAVGTFVIWARDPGFSETLKREYPFMAPYVEDEKIELLKTCTVNLLPRFVPDEDVNSINQAWKACESAKADGQTQPDREFRVMMDFTKRMADASNEISRLLAEFSAAS